MITHPDKKPWIFSNTIEKHKIEDKIMSCVEGDRSDCQPEANSMAGSLRLRAVVAVEG